jgi:hypothetical protein
VGWSRPRSSFLGQIRKSACLIVSCFQGVGRVEKTLKKVSGVVQWRQGDRTVAKVDASGPVKEYRSKYGAPAAVYFRPDGVPCAWQWVVS